MLSYQQHLAHHFASAAAAGRRRSPSPHESRENEKRRSMSPPDVTFRHHQQQQQHKEALDYVRTHMRRRSLSRSNSPVRSHSPTFLRQEHNHHLLIKRSLSEEDLRATHERSRRLSFERSSTTEYHHHAITHRPQILMNYHHRNEDHEGDSDSEKMKNEEQDEDAPLDLSMGSKKRRGRADSGTDSDDSTGMGDEGRGNEGRAYKKSLMKRYCKFPFYLLQIAKWIEKFSLPFCTAFNDLILMISKAFSSFFSARNLVHASVICSPIILS